MKLIFIGDVFGKAGRHLVQNKLSDLQRDYQPDFIVMNAENLADGKGLTEKTARPLFEAGIDAMTGGNHLWDRQDSLQYIRDNKRIVKPMNYPDETPGSSFYTITKGKLSLTVINLCGQIYMPSCDSPFIAFEKQHPAFSEASHCILLDFHAESTAEKRAMGWFVDGKVSAIMGTHTHIQTADEEILPLGTAYLTDVGMTGAHDSVIGIKKNIIVEKLRTSIPRRYEASDRGLQINAVYLELDDTTGKASLIHRIRQTVEK
ncbi:MAG: TIGR00282 family metallophosphoesterase [Candidatus Cloacimonadota bacterium]